MKIKLGTMFTILVICFGMISCSNPSSSGDYTTYKVEVGVISNSTYNTATNRISSWTELTYANISSLRLYLYNNTISDHAIETGVRKSEIKEFMLSRGFSNYEVDLEMELLKQIGNDIAFFEHATDSTKKVWMYVTK